MRVAFVLPSLSRSGGVDVVLRYVRALRAAQGVDAHVVALLPGGDPIDGLGAVQPLSQAVRETWDLAVATWWTTAHSLPELGAARRALFVQGCDERFYDVGEVTERLGAALALARADGVIAASSYLERVVATTFPELPVEVVVNGIDKETFRCSARPVRQGRMRVLLEGQPELAIKGLEQARAALDAMREPVHVTHVSLEPSSALRADRSLHGLSPSEMAQIYADSDVLLKLSRSEGLGMPPLEAAHMGTPSILAPFGGQVEWLEHGRNGIEVGFDDIPGTTAWLDLLARDRALLQSLSDGARAAAAAWPSEDMQTSAMAAACRRIVEREPVRRSAIERYEGRTLWRHIEVAREVRRMHAHEIESRDAALATERERLRDAREEVTDLWSRIDRLNALVEELFKSRAESARRLEEVTATRAYRAATTLRRLVRRP